MSGTILFPVATSTVITSNSLLHIGSIDTEYGHCIAPLNKNCLDQAINHDLLVSQLML